MTLEKGKNSGVDIFKLLKTASEGKKADSGVSKCKRIL